MRVTEAIKVFLNSTKTPANADLVARWTPGMEVQINVAQGDGEPVEGKRTTYSDGLNEWWSIRCPKNADGKAGEPFWNDYELTFPFELHAEGIGMTGWKWTTKQSLFVAFDYDSLVGHAKGIGVSDEDLEKVKLAAENLPYIETRRSTGGLGIHLYAYLNNIPTDNHTTHAALARCVLGMMSTDTGFDFASAIDACGSIIWQWHRKMTAENHGLELIKPATKVLSVEDLPANWRDNIEVVQKKRSKVRINDVALGELDTFEALTSSRKAIPLDETHKEHIEHLIRSGFTTLWIADHHLLQAHTCALAKLKEELKLPGTFTTNSQGNNPGSPNCFCFPLHRGGWKVYRFSMGINEAETWSQDKAGWTTCYFNRAPDLGEAARIVGGVEDPDKIGQYLFDSASDAVAVAAILGEQIDIKEELLDRQTRLKPSKDGRLAIEITKEDDDKPWKGWIAKKGKWVRVFESKTDGTEDDIGDDHDDMIRELETPAKEGAGWVVRKGSEWVREQAPNVSLFLIGSGVPATDVSQIMGKAVVKSWRLVDLPFQAEYPGGRQWNMDAAQLRFAPADLSDEECPHHPHWDMILNHIGRDLNTALRADAWMQRSGLQNGSQYLTAWIASMIRFPFSPLPYLFLYGPENSGKSIFHEAISLLMTKGFVPADRALTSAGDFNGELANCILAVVEEKDISKSNGALNKIKEWVTARFLSIRKMRTDSYTKANTTHWVQCANRQENCPVFPGDTRITVIHVPDLLPDQEIPKERLLELLTAEAPHFMYTLMKFELPEAMGRLRIPVVMNSSKQRSTEDNRSALEEFISDYCFEATGVATGFKEFFDKFYDSLTNADRDDWTTAKVIKGLPSRHASGVFDGKKCVANLSLVEVTVPEDAKPLVLVDGKLIPNQS